MGRTFFPPQAIRRGLNLMGGGISDFPRRARVPSVKDKGRYHSQISAPFNRPIP
jgi:hypothetical protein